MLRQQSGRAKRHTHLCVFLLRPPLPKARRRGGRQFFGIFDCAKISDEGGVKLTVALSRDMTVLSEKNEIFVLA